VSLLLEARDLTAILPGDHGDVRVLDGVSLGVAPGEIVDVVGPSGSGKSTLLRALGRLLPVSSGALLYDGAPAETLTPQQWRRVIALVPQKPVLVSGSLRDNLLLPWTLAVRKGQRAPGDDVLAAGLARLGVDAALDRDATRLSVGQAARVALLRTLLTGPRVLLLDEPDAALDDVSADEVSTLTAEFAAGTAPGIAAGQPAAGTAPAIAPGAVIRVRHHRPDGLATRRLHLEHGVLCAAEEVAR
jgi:putative ABC transport system ATP-binding protein